MKTVRRVEIEDIEYIHTYTEHPKKGSKAKPKQKEFTLRLRARPKGMAKWIELGPDGRYLRKPTPETADDFLEFVIYPDDLVAFADAIESGHFEDADRYELALMAFGNSTGETEFRSYSARWASVQDAVLKLEGFVQAAHVQAAGKEVDAPNSEEVTAPLDD